MRKCLLLIALWSASPQPASAQFIQQRFLPPSGERGVVGEQQAYPGVQINRRLLRLAPGARIYDTSNRTIVHGQLPPGVEVFYAREQSGDVQRIYILTEQELVALKQAGKR